MTATAGSILNYHPSTNCIVRSFIYKYQTSCDPVNLIGIIEDWLGRFDPDPCNFIQANTFSLIISFKGIDVNFKDHIFDHTSQIT